MTTPLRIVYAGTPDFAVPALQALLRTDHLVLGHQVVAVYTQPDRPAGRGRVLTPSPVKAVALEAQLPVMQPLNFRDSATVDALRAWQPDLMVVAAYGLLLPQVVLDIPRYGCINLHASLLPRWRGAAPIQRAILAGDTQTGITLMRMEAGLDTGPMLRRVAIDIGPHETAGELQQRLAQLGAEMLIDLLNESPTQLMQGEVQPTEGVTYAHKLQKTEAMIDWQQSAAQLEARVRAFNPRPVAETTLHGQQLRIWRAARASATHERAPGTVLSVTAQGIEVACGEGSVLSLLTVQAPGRKALPVADFIRSHDLNEVRLGAEA